MAGLTASFQGCLVCTLPTCSVLVSFTYENLHLQQPKRVFGCVFATQQAPAAATTAPAATETAPEEVLTPAETCSILMDDQTSFEIKRVSDTILVQQGELKLFADLFLIVLVYFFRYILYQS